MKWVRQAFVYLLSLILLGSLMGMALATSAQVSLTHPNKTEQWLSQSNLYPNLATIITNQAQTAIENNVTGGGSISKTVVQQAAQSAFPQSLLRQSVQTFLNSNYAWLEGKTKTPDFKIDLSGVKQEFASEVANTSVLAHLTGLPTCTVEQTSQLESANPLLLSCLPLGISAQSATFQVSQQLANNSAFLGNPVITASTVSTKGLSGGEPYYKKLSALPKYYQFAEKLPWILGIINILCIIGIIVCSRTKRLGLRRVAVLLLVSGALLVADKFATDALFNNLRNRIFSSVNNGQVQQSLTSFAHYVEAELVKVDLWFGIIYIALALLLLAGLILTRNRKPKSSKQAKVKPQADNAFATSQPQEQPSLNTIKSRTAAIGPTQAARPNLKKRPPSRRPPRLIQ